MSYVETSARAGMAEFSDLPAYVEPKVQTEERKIVQRLIDIHDASLDTVDEKVAASTKFSDRGNQRLSI